MTGGDVGPLGTVTCVRGEAFVVSTDSGEIPPGGDTGLFVRDTRFLDCLRLEIDDAAPRTLIGGATSAATADFHGYADVLGSDEPLLHVRRRRAIDGALHEEIQLINRAREQLQIQVVVEVGTDFAYIFDVKHHRSLPRATPEPVAGGVRFTSDDGRHTTEVTAEPPPSRVDGDRLSFDIAMAPRTTAGICLDVVVTDVYGEVRPQQRCAALHVDTAQWAPPEAAPRVRSGDRRFERLIEQSMVELEALRMPDPDGDGDEFLAAGSPWYLTLFGRDSIWAAFMALPMDPTIAVGTLRTLARRQGTRHDEDTEEAPGKILHEVRRGSLTHRGDLPPNYYGTIDATPLFVMLANEVWRWGSDEAAVETLLPNVEAALAWMREDGDPDGDGFLEYMLQGTRGLFNQGWKDSDDGIQFADGRIAEPPIALCEVQGYAYDAAVRGAELLDYFGRGAGDWKRWADDLRARFRDHFWVSDEEGRFPAVALDVDDTPVDAVTSNPGHLLMTGILDGDTEVVAERLADRTMASGFGLRTMSTTAAGYNPLSYHGGSVWPHDTAIAVWGLAVNGHGDAAHRLMHGLVEAAPTFGFRLPELLGGQPASRHGFPVPYPTACRPQAWSCGGALLLLRSALGLLPDVPRGEITLRPPWPPLVPSLEVEGLPIGGGRLDVRVSAVDGVEVATHGLDVQVRVEGPARDVGVRTRTGARR